MEGGYKHKLMLDRWVKDKGLYRGELDSVDKEKFSKIKYQQHQDRQQHKRRKRKYIWIWLGMNIVCRSKISNIVT